METTIDHVGTRIQTLVFLVSSLLLTSLMFLIDSDSSQGALDSFLSLGFFVALFTLFQVGLSKLIGKRLLGWTKVLTSMTGGIMAAFGLYVLTFTILYLVKF